VFAAKQAVLVPLMRAVWTVPAARFREDGRRTMLNRESQGRTSRRKGGEYTLLRRTRGDVHHHKSRLAAIPFATEQEDRTLACRYEMKYVINEPQALAIMRFVELYLKLDPYSRVQPEGFYPIVSLYLDSPDLRLCRESLEGHKNRFKLRIRSYSDDPHAAVFLEIKRRMNSIIIKSRARMRREDAQNVVSGGVVAPRGYRTDEDALRQFQLYMHSISAGPMVRIRYMRKAYEGDADNRVRVTFDSELAYNIGSVNTFLLNGDGWRVNRVGGIVLEIKFTGRYPIWLNQMVECFGLRSQSMSKYATSIRNSCLQGFCAPKKPILRL